MVNDTWNHENIKSLKNKVIVITGGNTGLGFEAAKVFAKKNATVILACRSLERGEAAKNKILLEVNDAIVNVMKLDLGNLSSIHLFVQAFKSRYSQLDILLNNAGIMTIPYEKTDDGFEKQNGVNHLGHFALTAQLFDIISQTPHSRIVNVSSNAHKMGNIDFNNYLYEHGKYSKIGSYARSKLSNLLFTYELARRVEEKHLDILVLAAHPGVANTDLGRYMTKSLLARPFFWMFSKIASTPYEGALPEIRACLDNTSINGLYYGPSKKKGFKKQPVVVESSVASHREDDAKKLWTLSEKLTKVTFNI
ncbi:MAG: short-chain dehydrogenase [Tenericutes bacterium HGW-Tenericutes-1]|jgi:NAD(P)-dependent dehydrogenase (short-subunit alcohol dehydrogenase family)|nr:MAG: short-chain dehydrogenase [Tenericutes bacterium HGW-Tenericutes-1]